MQASASTMSRSSSGSFNHAASGNGAIASLFHFERLGRAVPEPLRSTKD